MPKLKKFLLGLLKYGLLTLALIVTIYPLYWMAMAGTMEKDEVYKLVFRWLPGNSLASNYQTLSLAFDMVQVFMNTVYVAVIGTFLSVIVNVMMGYALSKYEFRLKKIIFSIFVVTLFVGGAAVMIPQFELIHKLGLYNTLTAIIIVGIYSPYISFLSHQILMDFPTGIIEAGRIDGCGEVRIFFSLVLPNVKALLSTISIICFMGYWNGYLWNLIVTSSTNKYTLQVALASIYPKAGIWFYAPLKMLGSTISIVPILLLFILMQKNFINSVAGAVKG